MRKLPAHEGLRRLLLQHAIRLQNVRPSAARLPLNAERRDDPIVLGTKPGNATKPPLHICCERRPAAQAAPAIHGKQKRRTPRPPPRSQPYRARRLAICRQADFPLLLLPQAGTQTSLLLPAAPGTCLNRRLLQAASS